MKIIAHEMQVKISQVKNEVRKVSKDSTIVFVKKGEKTSKRKDVKNFTWSKRLGDGSKCRPTFAIPTGCLYTNTDTTYSHLFTEVIKSNIDRVNLPSRGKYWRKTFWKNIPLWVLRTALTLAGFDTEIVAGRYAAWLLRCLSRLGFIQKSARVLIKKVSDTALRCSFWKWLKRMGHDWSSTARRKESPAKGINSNNSCNQPSRVHRKSPSNSLEIQKKQRKTD